MSKWISIIVLAIVLAFNTSAETHEALPAHYHVGEDQPFQGLVCRSQEPAMHIFNTWIEKDIVAARNVFLVYQMANECKHLVGYHAFFIEELARETAPGFDGELDKVLVFSVSPTEGSEVVDFLVTWENIGESV